MPEAGEHDRQAVDGAGGRSKPAVLVVDDCPTVRDRMREILEGAEYDVRLAQDGVMGLEAARRDPPDIILVDFVMPGMNGYQFCQSVRRVDELKAVPVVLVSVKAEQVGEQFIRLGLADDVLSKPFQPAALRAVVAGRLERPSARADQQARGPRESEPPPPERFVADPQEEARRRAARAIERTREILVSHLLPEIERALGPDAAGREALRAAVAGALSESALRAFLPALADLDPHAGVASFSGALEALPVGEVFQMIALQNLTGVMEIERPGFTARIFFSKGRMDLSRLDGEEQTYRLGHYLVQDDLVSSMEIERLAAQSEGASEPLGERLIKLGLITRDDLQEALRRQATDIFYEVLRWRHGVFRFRPNVRPDEAERAGLAIPVSGLLMEGYRRVDEWRLIEKEIRDFAEVFEQNPATIADLEAGTLSTEETLVLDHVTGTHSVADVIRLVQMDSFEACRILYRLLSMRLIRRVRDTADSA